MKISITTTNGKAQATGPLMHKMVETYYLDMLPFSHLSILQIYDLIKSIPFRPDPPNLETLMRPLYTMQCIGPGGDCDDKSIALASYAKIHSIPYRFIAVRRRGNFFLHHVYPELYIYNKWVIADPTYNFNCFGRERERYAEYRII